MQMRWGLHLALDIICITSLLMMYPDNWGKKDQKDCQCSTASLDVTQFPLYMVLAKTTWNVWQTLEEVTFSVYPLPKISLDIEVLQHFRILSYEYCSHREKLFSWICPSNSWCPNSTPLMRCFLSRSHLGIDVCCLSWDSRCWEVGLETNTDKWIEATLDNRGRHFIHMQWANLLWLQQSLPWLM